MSTSLFLNLPREIRDMIYGLLLAPTGYILPRAHYPTGDDNDCGTWELVPAGRPVLEQNIPVTVLQHAVMDMVISDALAEIRIRKNPVPLSLLQVCKQVSEEAKEVLYKENIMIIDISSKFTSRFRFNLTPTPSKHVRHVWISFPSVPSRPWLLREALETLYEWEGLESITINLTSGGEGLLDLVKSWVFEEILKIFRNIWAGEKFPKWQNMRRTLDLRVWRLPHPGTVDLEEAISSLHDAFGGELRVDNRLCYKDGKVILRPI